ncbi:unnamed protein product [Schistocephalus solidus]|uniref:Potassium voltage-gated channel subfamily H member 2 n=1 Tax=Schistocephalus solidus TaxID=70667 RepID=A0A183SIJ7_SCHSO|nr:unnamed protein product [Schistocephalus solidus]
MYVFCLLSEFSVRTLAKDEPSQNEPGGFAPVASSSSAALSPPLASPKNLDKDFPPQQQPLAASITDLPDVVSPESSVLPYYTSSLPISCAGLENENRPIKSATNKLDTSPSSSSLTPIKFESLKCTPEKLLPFSWAPEYHQRQQYPTGRSGDSSAPTKPSPMKAEASPLSDLESLEMNVVGPLEQMLDAIEQHLNLLESEVRRLEEQEKEEAKRRCHLGKRIFQSQDQAFFDGSGVVGGDSSCRLSSASSCSSLSSSLTSPSRSTAVVGATSLSPSTSSSSSSCSSPSHPATTSRDRFSSASSAIDSRLIPTSTVGTFRRQPAVAAAIRGCDFPLRRSSVTGAQDRRAANRGPFSGSKRHLMVTVPSSRSFPPLSSALDRPDVRTTSNGQQHQQQDRLRQMYTDSKRPAGWQPRPADIWHTSTTNDRYCR